MPEFKGGSDGYESPAYKGDGGDRARPKASGGKNSGDYDNAPAKSKVPMENDSSRLGGGGKKGGYDNASIEKDFGFSGHGKRSKGGLK